ATSRGISDAPGRPDRRCGEGALPGANRQLLCRARAAAAACDRSRSSRRARCRNRLPSCDNSGNRSDRLLHHASKGHPMRFAAIVVLLGSVLLTHAVASRPAAQITFTQAIAPIIYANCVTCHRPGEAAPFPLISYEDVMKRGSLIAKVTQSRYMPPWKAAHGYGEFKGERRLTDEQIAAISEWVKQGMPR